VFLFNDPRLAEGVTASCNQRTNLTYPKSINTWAEKNPCFVEKISTYVSANSQFKPPVKYDTGHCIYDGPFIVKFNEVFIFNRP
jgi:hypothetical protein